MNFFSPNSTNGYRPSARSGLSIIEVLTSVVVAMIGVFGVLALIPFAVKQASLGLDSDAAVTTARNAISQMEITGMQIPQNWALLNVASGQIETYDPNGVGDDAPGVFSLDPLGILELARIEGTTTLPNETDFGNASFPFQIYDPAGTYPGDLVIPAANFVRPIITPPFDPTVHQFDLELARRMCRSTNDLVFGEPDLSDDTDLDGDGIPDSSVSGPIQFFDQDGGPQRRQFKGRISWSAIVAPFTNDLTAPSVDRWSYRMYILVYKDRQFDEFILNADDTVNDLGGAMTVALLDTSALDRLQSPVSVVEFPDSISLSGAVKRDDWVLLINRPDPSATPGFDMQLAFYRVVNFSDEDEVSSASITLDGPDFDFGPAGTSTYICLLYTSPSPRDRG